MTMTRSHNGRTTLRTVRHEQAADAEPVLQLLQQVKDDGPNRHVERRGRFVEDHQFGIEGDRAGDPDPRLLATRQLVRKAVEQMRRQPDMLGQLLSSTSGDRASAEAMRTGAA
jgi:hypothetical protein